MDDRGHPEFWEERDGRVHYTPTSSAGSTGDNYAYADDTFDGGSGLLEWPLALEVEAYARDASAGLGAMLVEGGVQAGLGNVILGITDSAYTGGGDSFRVWNTEETVDVGTARDNETWYTYRLVVDSHRECTRRVLRRVLRRPIRVHAHLNGPSVAISGKEQAQIRAAT